MAAGGTVVIATVASDRTLILKNLLLNKSAAGAATAYLEFTSPSATIVQTFVFSNVPSGFNFEAFMVCNPGDSIRVRSDPTSLASITVAASGALLFGAPS